MQIAIISDTHDQISYMQTFFSWTKEKKVDVIFHCGDITTLDTFSYLYNTWEKDLYVCLGNADSFKYGSDIWKYELPRHVHLFEEEGTFNINELSFHINHYPDMAKNAAQKGMYDFVFHGHTHKPWMQKINNTYVINPGTLGGLRFAPTFCHLDTTTKRFELIRVFDLSYENNK